MAKKKQDNIDIVVKPVGNLGGLDRIHVALGILVLILVALLLMVTYSYHSPVISNATTTTTTINNNNSNTISLKTCAYSFVNGTCAPNPVHSQAEVMSQLEKIIASYNNVQGQISLLPYLSKIQNSTIIYNPNNQVWYAVIPALNPNTENNFYITFSIYDKNLSVQFATTQMAQPSEILNNSVVSQGVVSLSGKFACKSNNSVQVYWFMDPYATGSVQSLQKEIALQNRFGRSVNVSLEMLYGPASSSIANTAGTANTQQLERYILCASKQNNATNFETNLQSAFSEQYISGSILSSIANASKLNISSLNQCVNSANTTVLLNRQALLAEYYNISTTPVVIVNCKYMAIPQTTYNATCYADPSLCQS
jgi:hypothetical protein